MTSHITLPIVTVQSDFADVIADVDAGLVPSDHFWLSCYKSGEPSVHAQVNATLDDVDRNLIRFSAKDGDVDFVKAQNAYTAACSSLDVPPTPILQSVQEYTDTNNTLRPRRITAFDVSPDKTRFAIGHLDGSLSIHPISPPPNHPQKVNISNKRKLVAKPHVSNITHIQFFPSSRVLLSSGADFSLSILSAEFPDAWSTPSESSASSGSGHRVQPVRVLRGHTRSVTSATIVDLGRNIISSSLDSSLKLWDVPSGDIIHTLNSTSPVLCTTMGKNEAFLPPDGEEQAAREKHEREDVHVQQTVTYAGLQNGSIQVFDWRTRSNLILSEPPPPSSPSVQINAIAHLSQQSLLATGSSNGMITLYDVRSLSPSSPPLTSFRRNEAGISDLAFQYHQQRVGLAIATKDGLPYVASIIPDGPGVQAELVGVDCDPVGNIRVVQGDDNAGEVWTASDDGIVRRYVL